MNARHGQAAKPSGNRLQLTFAYRSRSRTLALPRSAAVILFLLLPMAALIYLAATCYFIFHDDVLAGLMQHQAEMQYAYEDRLAALHRDVENATQQAQADAADFAQRLKALTQREDQVESRTQLVAAFADRLKQMRLPPSTDPAAASADSTSEIDAPPASTGPASFAMPPDNPAPFDGKPHPAGFDLRLQDKSGSADEGSSSQSSNAGAAPIAFDSAQSIKSLIGDLVARYDRTDETDLALLDDLERPANKMSEHVRATLAAVGLSAGRFETAARGATATRGGGVGGPFVPLPILSDGSAFASTALQVQNALATAEDLQNVLPHVPLKAPLPGDLEVTSPFGPRIDPFLGKPALHTGVDLRGAFGAPVRATAPGKVIYAGSEGGYGNLVEIDNGNGLSTRYAHLSSIDVRQGDRVITGSIIGHIGETGRATGPHLHYEVRIDGQPVDPERFLRAGATMLATAAL